MLSTLFLIIASYFLGSINNAILIARLLKLPDPRTSGSKNPGATNVLRTGGKLAAFIVLLLDVLKGVFPVLIAKIIGLSDIAVGLVGLVAILGHVFPLYFKFAGGKGVATEIGVLFSIHWSLGLIFMGIWLLVAIVWRYSSLAALVATAFMPLLSIPLAGIGYIIPLLGIAIVVFYRHKTNITRLRAGTESKIASKRQ